MRVVRDLSFFKSTDWLKFVGESPVGVTIGNFDGMHRGHQALFSTLSQELASIPNAKKILLTFAPHPRRFFVHKKKWELDRDTSFAGLSSVRERVQCAANLGFDAIYFIRFNQRFASLEPQEFVARYLQEALRTRVIVVGHDWCFGRGRRGTPESLAELARGFDCKVVVVPPVVVNEFRVGSRLVKTALEAGEVEQAAAFLGRNFCMTGRVRRGDRRGRMIGFPTANLEFVSRVLPANGVYATKATVKGQQYYSVTNVGVRPTFSPPRQVVEVHLFSDSYLDLYGELLTVEFVTRLRDERRFAGVEELRAAIAADIARARELFGLGRS